jgi:SAM-dependent methyltransferase
MDQKVYRDMAAVELKHWWFRARTSVVGKFISKYLPATELEILDLGCGSGNNGEMLSRFGQVDGVEPEEFALGMARERGKYRNLRLGALTVDSLDLPSNHYDLVVMTDVLEHIERDREALKEVYSLLKPGGKLVLTVPALPWLWSHHDVAHFHFRRYTARTFHAAMADSGLTVEYLSYYNFFLFPVIALARFVKMLIPNTKTKPDTGVPVGIINEALCHIFTSEAHLLTRGVRFPIGVSLISVLTKQA